MKVVDENGKVYSWNLYGYMPNSDDTRPRSKLHLNVRSILKELYPTDAILEEVPIPGKILYIDFYLPLRKMAIEVNGEQHYTYNNFHYPNKKDFLEAQRRDTYKKNWCEWNGIKLVTIRFDEDDTTIRRKLEG
jgi:hypothetical protein